MRNRTILLLAPLFLAAPFARADEPIRVLLIDGNGAAGVKKGGDAYYIETVLKSVKGYAPAVKDAAALEKPDLKQYPVVFLLNVPELSDAARAKLEDHVKAGGGAAFFLGDQVRPVHYNRRLYRKGEGIFPVALASQPTDPPKKAKSESVDLDKPALCLRESRHPVCADLVPTRGFFSLLAIDRHYPVARPKKGFPAGVRELIASPNDGGMEPFKAEAQKLNKALPVADERYKDYRPGLEWHQWALRKVLVFGKKAWELGDVLDALLEDKGDPKDAERPDLSPFWGKAEVKELRQKIAALRDKSRYGDPLVVAAPFGKGRVVVCLTSAGESWNNWAGGLAAPTFVILTENIAKYLSHEKSK